MNMRSTLLALALSASLTSMPRASVIDFENLVNNGSPYTIYGTTVDSGGYHFEGLRYVASNSSLCSWIPSFSGYTGSIALLSQFDSERIRMTRIGGGSFSVLSIDLADVYLGSGSQSITFTGTRSDFSTIDEVIQLTSPASLTTYAFGAMTDIVQLEWSQGPTSGPWHQFDNINVASPVPEPLTLGLAGLALASVARRRLRKSR